MELTKMNITDFSQLLASDAPAPGGGSVAALHGALGASLILMVANLTIGKKKYEAHQNLVREILVEAEDCRRGFLELIERDTAAFNTVSAVFSMPKNTDDEKKARSEAMQQALKTSTAPPFEMLRLTQPTLVLAEKMIGHSNTNAASDLGVAAASLKAAAKSAWLNVLINLGSIKDSEFIENHRREGEKMLSEILPLADSVFTKIENECQG